MQGLDLETIKNYMRVDYDDDDGVIELQVAAVLDEMAELIPDFDREAPTARQKLLILTFVKDLYDHREKYAEKQPGALQAAVSSMLLKEMYK